MGRFVIRLENLHFYSDIGVFEQERNVGNEFQVDVTLETDDTRFIPEHLDTSISYADIYEVVESNMKREWLLLESVSKSIGDSIKSKWNEVKAVKVRISKLSTPIAGIQGVCSVEYLAD